MSNLTRLYKKSENSPILKHIEYASISSFDTNVHCAAYKSRRHEREIAMSGIDAQNHHCAAHIAFRRASFLQRAFYTTSTFAVTSAHRPCACLVHCAVMRAPAKL